MAAEVPLETRSKIDSYVRRIAKRDYPPVFVADTNTDAHELLMKMEDHRLPEKRRIEIAKKDSIPVLSGLDVVQYLRGEMDEADEWALRDLVLRISAAKQGMLALYDDTPERLALMGQQGECPLAVKVVPIEEIVQKDTEEWWLFGTLEALAQDHPAPFIIPPTEAVTAFLKEHGVHYDLHP